ncbi:Qat anti-phage system TatD family nuclease QatD [Erythrobacter sp.]|jgi:TatD DNase family protein|uniref:Qat anti-phage system TatD family nuclease QatD n=1 Tax=Erythrobacter sp. TaxID=1042 RepID=UPI002EA86748|nr:Qat anti-phage system TatD family nuclease QatD [Erythrobacter sp.]
MIDFHCHLDLYPDPQSVARACQERGLYVLSVTTTPSAWRGTSALVKDAVRIRTALGLHPQIAHERAHELTLLEQLVFETPYVGEIGLDGGPEYSNHCPKQLRVFERALAICRDAGGRVMSLHSRRASGEVLDALHACPGAGTPILHWFSGPLRDLDRAIELGCWFSVGPAMLRGVKGRQLAARMPIDRVLIESDGPFAQVDGRAAWPWEAVTAIPDLAKLWRIDEGDCERQLMANLAAIGKIAVSPQFQ